MENGNFHIFGENTDTDLHTNDSSNGATMWAESYVAGAGRDIDEQWGGWNWLELRETDTDTGETWLVATLTRPDMLDTFSPEWIDAPEESA